MRAHLEAQAGLAMLMTYYKQNGRLSVGQRGGTSLRNLRPVIHRDSPAVRVCINRIRPAVEMANSRQMPREIDWNVLAQGMGLGDEIAARVADHRLTEHFKDIKGLPRLRYRHLWSSVLGSVVVRRVLSCSPTGKGLTDKDGEPILGKNGKQRQIRRFGHDWMISPPYEFVRDPSAQTGDFSEESCVGHEKPMPAEDLLRRFGLTVTTKMTMGQLFDFQAFIHKATGHNLSSGMEHNTRPGVLFSEWWFRDQSPESGGKWLFYMLAYRDVVAEDPGERSLKPLFFGANPYVDLPLHHFTYLPVPNWAWGMGIPMMVLDEQHLLNDAMTSMLRVMLEQGGSRIMYEQGSLENPRNAHKIFARRYGVISINKSAKYPQRLQSPTLDQHAVLFSQGANEMFDRALNQGKAQRGEGGTRTPLGVEQLRQEAADATITSRIDSDRLEINNLLTGTLGDVCLVDTDGGRSLKSRRELKEAFSPTEIDAYLARARGWRKRPFRVEVSAESLQPKTPREVREELYPALQAELISPEAARRAYLIRTGRSLDPLEGDAYRKQRSEIHAILKGRPIEAASRQDHKTHLWVIQAEKESARWETYSQDQKDKIEAHEDEHTQLQVVEAQEQIMQESGAEGPGEQAPPMEEPQAMAMPAAPPEMAQPGMEQAMEPMPAMGGMI